MCLYLKGWKVEYHYLWIEEEEEGEVFFISPRVPFRRSSRVCLTNSFGLRDTRQTRRFGAARPRPNSPARSPNRPSFRRRPTTPFLFSFTLASSIDSKGESVGGENGETRMKSKGESRGSAPKRFSARVPRFTDSSKICRIFRNVRNGQWSKRRPGDGTEIMVENYYNTSGLSRPGQEPRIPLLLLIGGERY